MRMLWGTVARVLVIPQYLCSRPAAPLTTANRYASGCLRIVSLCHDLLVMTKAEYAAQAAAQDGWAPGWLSMHRSSPSTRALRLRISARPNRARVGVHPIVPDVSRGRVGRQDGSFPRAALVKARHGGACREDEPGAGDRDHRG